MKNFFGQRWVELLITILSFGLCFSLFPFVTDDYAAFSWNEAAGQFSNYPICEFYWGTLGLSKVISFLYHHWPRYNWTGGFMIATTFCCLYLALRIIKNAIFKNSRSFIIIRLGQVLFVLFFTQNIIYLSATRPSILFCGIALINLLFTEKPGKTGIALNTFIFIFGMLIHPESSGGMLLVVSLGYLIHRFNLLHLLKRIFLPAAATVIMLFAYYLDWSHSNLFLKRIEPEVEYKLMEKRVIGIEAMKTALDSVKYEAAAAGVCFDTRTLTPDYFRSILLPGADLSFHHAAKRFFQVLSFYRYYLFLPCCCLIFILLCLFQPDARRCLFKIILFQLGTFVILNVVNYTGGLIAGRHFLNIQLISLLITAFYFFRADALSGFWRQKASLGYGVFLTAVSLFCLLLLIWGTCVSLKNYKEGSDAIAEASYCHESAVQEMDNLYANRIIVLTTDNFHIFDHVFSWNNKKYTRNTYLMFDVWTYYLDPEYLNYLGRECNCDPLNPVAFYSWLSANNAFYIAEDWRYNLTARYMNLVHGQKLNFEHNNDYKKPDCINNTNMKAFELRKVVVEP